MWIPDGAPVILAKSTDKSFTKKHWYTTLFSQLRQLVLRVDHKMLTQTMMENLCCCHSGVGIVIHPGMGTVKGHNTVPCESNLISKQDVCYKMCVYNIAFCKKPLEKHHPCMMVRSEGLQLLDLVWVKWLFMENSPNKSNNDTFSSCCSSYTGSWIFFHSSQYANLKTRPYLSRH
jgi:hypothetical protein